MKKLLTWPAPLLQKWLLSLLLCLPFLAAAIVSAFSGIPFQRQRRVILQKTGGEQLVFCIEKNKRLSVGQAYQVYLPVSTVVHEVKNTYLPCPCALAVEKIEPASFDCEESAD